MKVFKLNIDTAKPIRQVVTIPVDTQKYGLAVKATANGRPIASPYCSIIDNGTTLSASKTLDDGSFLFEMTANAGDGAREAMVYVINTDELSAAQWNGFATTDYPAAADADNTDLHRIVRVSSIWYLKKDGTYFADDELITFTADTQIGRTVLVTVGKRTRQEFQVQFTIPAGKYYPRELDRAVLGGSVGLPANCKVKVVLKPSTKASPATVLDEPVQSVTIDGVDYVPTTITVDGTEYVVLAATPNETTTEPEPTEPTEEPTNEDNP